MILIYIVKFQSVWLNKGYKQNKSTIRHVYDYSWIAEGGYFRDVYLEM